MLSRMGDVKDTVESICQNIGKANYLIVFLLIALAINLIATVGRIVVDIFLKNKDKGIHKANLITSKSIEVQKDVYDNIFSLSNFDVNQSQELFDEITEIKNKIKKERIHFDKKLFKIAFEALDYFLVVSTDYSKKDFKFEDEVMMLYAEQYRK
ncbi:hypothetical protein ACFOWA_00055 [Pedobacter lithocola]|uniref:Uncharacterized protein n=1 Tax=Pedobacter lithocola TaxID=1908239 RepID=A0ABV8P5R7_9SPHI